MTIRHSFSSAKADGGDATLVKPSDWNAAHTMAPTLPTVVAVGASASGTGDISPGLPTGHTTNDILLLFVQSSNQVITAPAGYTQLGPQNGIGAAAGAATTRLGIFWKRDGGSESAPTVTDTGDHTLGQIMAVRGCPTDRDPFHFDSNGRKTTASTTGTATGAETTLDNCLVVVAFAHAIDSAAAQFTGWTNGDLTNVTEQIDVSTQDGANGGIGVATATKASAGPFGSTTVTEGASTVDVSSTFVMIPNDSSEVTESPRGAEVQVFIGSSGSPADTWVKPTGAKAVEVVAIGGGSGGGAGGHGGATSARAAGGGGGGGGECQFGTFRASELTATLVVTPGAGSAGGTAVSAGGVGGSSLGGSDSTVQLSGNNIIRARGGAFASGGGGNATSNNGGDAGAGGGATKPAASATGVAATHAAGWWGGGVSTAGTGAGGAGGGSDYGGCGGGVGGGNATTTAALGGNGGGQGINNAGGGGGGGGGASATAATDGGAGSTAAVLSGGGTATATAGHNGAGGAGTPGVLTPYGGGGGAGGGGRLSGGNGYAGGAGGLYGGGGGGGGGYGANDANSSGAGGAGGDGCIVIITYF